MNELSPHPKAPSQRLPLPPQDQPAKREPPRRLLAGYVLSYEISRKLNCAISASPMPPPHPTVSSTPFRTPWRKNSGRTSGAEGSTLGWTLDSLVQTFRTASSSLPKGVTGSEVQHLSLPRERKRKPFASGWKAKVAYQRPSIILSYLVYRNFSGGAPMGGHP